tara:strand:- start:18122 stop:18766 length:645 start_codon:yes stop_codon:yes gene_type:complete
MKDLCDAVNELKGDLNNTYLFSDSDLYLKYIDADGTWLCSKSKELDDGFVLISTTTEFRQLVEAMKYNFGKCDVDAVANYYSIKKEPLEPISTPLAYTQEMADRDVMPSVGMKCISNTSRCEVLAMNDFQASIRLLDVNDNYMMVVAITELNPIDTRTKKVELINGEAYQFMNRNGVILNGIYDKATRVFNVLQGRYFDVISCTNIKHLTVAEE